MSMRMACTSCGGRGRTDQPRMKEDGTTGTEEVWCGPCGGAGTIEVPDNQGPS